MSKRDVLLALRNRIATIKRTMEAESQQLVQLENQASRLTADMLIEESGHCDQLINMQCPVRFNGSLPPIHESGPIYPGM